MAEAYDKYYQTKDLFGAPYPELLAFFEQYPKKGKVLDLGCGQGRDAIALARLGYTVTGVDRSKVGVDQMTHIGNNENLSLHGAVGDIYTFDQFNAFDIILLDSMFHFAKKDREKEEALVKKMLSKMSQDALLVICIQDTGEKVEILKQVIASQKEMKYIKDEKFSYLFEDSENGHKSETDYRMIILEK